MKVNIRVLFATAVFLTTAGWRYGACEQALDWDVASINQSLEDVRKKPAKSASKQQQIVPLQVFTIAGSNADAFGLEYAIRIANYLYNRLDPYESTDGHKVAKEKSSDCNIAFEVAAPIMQLEVPETSQKLAHYRLDLNENATDGYYGNRLRLSQAEMAILETASQQSATGAIKIVFIQSLGGGYGHAYHLNYLKRGLEAMQAADELPDGKTIDELLGAYKNTILISDTADAETIAHEIGHVLTNYHHPSCMPFESADQCEWTGNLMLTGGISGGSDGILIKSQCDRMRRNIRNGLLD